MGRLGANNTCHCNGGLSWRWGWNSHFFFLSSDLQQIVETPCTPKEDTVCGCRKNQYQIGQADLFYCRNCSSCPNGIIANCEYGTGTAQVQIHLQVAATRIDICSPLLAFWHCTAFPWSEFSFGTTLCFAYLLSPGRLLFYLFWHQSLFSVTDSTFFLSLNVFLSWLSWDVCYLISVALPALHVLKQSLNVLVEISPLPSLFCVSLTVSPDAYCIFLTNRSRHCAYKGWKCQCTVQCFKVMLKCTQWHFITNAVMWVWCRCLGELPMLGVASCLNCSQDQIRIRNLNPAPGCLPPFNLCWSPVLLMSLECSLGCCPEAIPSSLQIQYFLSPSTSLTLPSVSFIVSLVNAFPLAFSDLCQFPMLTPILKGHRLALPLNNFLPFCLM